MRDELFEDLLESVRQMSAIERGRSKPVRKYSAEDIIGPEQAALIRARTNDDLPQGEFAADVDRGARQQGERVVMNFNRLGAHEA